MPPLASRILALTVFAATGFAQTYTWTQMSPANSPGSLYTHAMAFDSIRNVSVLFGGVTGGSASAETWEYDGSDWTQITTANSPSGRLNPTMVWESSRGRILLFGGDTTTGGGGENNETWTYDGTDWTQIITATSPTPRYWHSMSYDSTRDRTVVFGGFNASGDLDDTWEFDGTDWAQISPTVSPSPRAETRMAFDPARNVTVMFGGGNASQVFSDTYEYDGSTWTLVTTANNSTQLATAAMAYVPSEQKIVRFGGYDAQQTSYNNFRQFGGTSWAQIPTAILPSARDSHALCHDSARNKVVMYGGYSNGAVGDTWEYTPPGPIANASTYGAGCGSLPLTFTPTTQAEIGTTATALLNNAPSMIAAIAIGWSNTTYGGSSLPLDLGSMGMPGCQQLQSLNALAEVIVAGSGNVLQYDQPIPNSTIWFGVKFYTQGFCVAPAANAQGVIVSNGIQWTIGNR